jgi:hypothetical protein
MKDIHKTDILEDRLSISYEEGDMNYPAAAVLLYTRCCTSNHDHIALTKMDAVKLAHWLNQFITGVYDE